MVISVLILMGGNPEIYLKINLELLVWIQELCVYNLKAKNLST